jgi:methylmalonyl-CoA mutase N-terminal domain/subunit
MRRLCFGVLLTVSAIAVEAQGVAGLWKANIETPSGPFPLVFEFNVKGEAVTGTISNDVLPKFPIADGVVKGSELSFRLRTQSATFLYKGLLKGNTLTLKSTVVEEGAGAAPTQSLGGLLRTVTTLTATRQK